MAPLAAMEVRYSANELADTYAASWVQDSVKELAPGSEDQ